MYETAAIALLLAPLIAFFIALVGFRNQHAIAAGVVILGGLVSACTSIFLLIDIDTVAVISERWFTISGIDLEFGILLDGRTRIMGAVVGLVTLCIMVYSLGYMAQDPGRGRFFSFLALFEWAMLSFVYAPNLLQAFIFWEIVGLASFFLIGFWYHKPSAVAASKKAFLMTRIGDVGLFIGLILLFQSANTLDILGINAEFARPDAAYALDQGRVELIAALLFMGIVGKSAQFPLHTWLPDAMEGPTPVSALLHSATMVAAGVFLFARFQELFMDAETTRIFVLGIATFTAVLSSTMAMAAKDMKRILAFSSISQLGFMLMGLAAGSLFAGYFHLTTHAFFKALLFLCAGAYIHHVGSNDIVAIGRAGARKLKVTTIGLIVGGAALAGIPPLAGFFSKEQIIGSLSHVDSGAKMVFVVGAYAAAFLTAYYTFRMIFFVTMPNKDSDAVADEPAGAQHQSDDHHGNDGHAHDDHGEPLSMSAPIALLTVLALGAGFFGGQIGDILGLEVHSPSIGEMAPAVVIALLGAALAFFEFGRKGASQRGFIERIPGLHKLFVNRWYIDVIYRRTVIALALAIARLCFGTENKALDGGSDQIGLSTISTGDAMARAHNGRLQVYFGMGVVFTAVLLFLFLKLSG